MKYSLKIKKVSIENINKDKKAWMLIKEAGCDNYQVGDAMISQKHCNFFVNNGNAKSIDIENLMKKVNLKRSDFPDNENYEYICFTCWDAFSMEGFKKMKKIGVTTMTTYPWMLYGTMNDAPLEKKIEGMQKFYDEIICDLDN